MKLFEVRHHRQVIDYIDADSIEAACDLYRQHGGDPDDVDISEVEAVESNS